jgi:hypothetical protein
VTARYAFELSCPQCGGEVEHVSSGCPDIVSARAIAKCLRCLATLLLEVTVRREAVATPTEMRRKAMRDRVPA